MKLLAKTFYEIPAFVLRRVGFQYAEAKILTHSFNKLVLWFFEPQI